MVIIPGTRLDGGRPMRYFDDEVEPKITSVVGEVLFVLWAFLDQLVLGRPLLVAFPLSDGSQSDPGSLALGPRASSWVLGPNWKPSWLILDALSGALENSLKFLTAAIF